MCSRLIDPLFPLFLSHHHHYRLKRKTNDQTEKSSREWLIYTEVKHKYLVYLQTVSAIDVAYCFQVVANSTEYLYIHAICTVHCT